MGSTTSQSKNAWSSLDTDRSDIYVQTGPTSKDAENVDTPYIFYFLRNEWHHQGLGVDPKLQCYRNPNPLAESLRL